MANRHRAKGGRSGRPFYAGASSGTASEAAEKHGFKRGGHAVGRAFGGKVKGRADRRARGGATKSPFSSAKSGIGGSGGHAQAPHHGGASHKASGGAVEGFARGGKKEECPSEEDDEEDDGYARGGIGTGDEPKGMHYLGGRRRRARHKAKGGHTDIYITEGGTHEWNDDDHEKAAKGGGQWIQGAIKHPGALHKELGVPQGEKIPQKKLAKAASSDNPKLAKRAKLAETLKGFH